MSDLGERFRAGELANKLLNIVPEVATKDLINDAKLKGFISGDLQVGEKKHQAPYTFKPITKFLVCCNSLPVTRDKSYGYLRRLLILPFHVTIPEHERDPFLADKIIRSELSGLLNWALSGLVRLRAQGGFTIPTSSIAALKQYREELDPKQQFLDENLLRDPEAGVLLKDA